MAIDIKTFPHKPGVYIMKDKKGAVLYVGKAIDLQKRVKSYFGRESKERYQIKFLMERVESIEYVETRNEKEALLLEYKFIQEHKPKYNIDLKDNKTFIRVKLTAHAFPSIYVTRRVMNDGAEYFGPYTSAHACRDVIDHAVRFFKIRTCSDREFLNRSRPCIQYDMGRCTAPCTGLVSREEYARQVKHAEMFIKGESKELLKKLREEMKEESRALRFERASILRDLVAGIRHMLERQKVMAADEQAGREDGKRTASEDELYNIVAVELKRRLRLKEVPHLIECVDISNISGGTANGAIVAFIDGAPSKSRYRLFNIQREEEPNDYAMMAEVLERRFRHEEWGRPDLLMTDGGRGQLSIAGKVLSQLGIDDVPIVAIAKIKGSHKKSSDTAQVFLPNRINPLKFKKGAPALLYLIRIRDEAHRFAIGHHRRRHAKRSLAA